MEGTSGVPTLGGSDHQVPYKKHFLLDLLSVGNEKKKKTKKKKTRRTSFGYCHGWLRLVPTFSVFRKRLVSKVYLNYTPGLMKLTSEKRGSIS